MTQKVNYKGMLKYEVSFLTNNYFPFRNLIQKDAGGGVRKQQRDNGSRVDHPVPSALEVQRCADGQGVFGGGAIMWRRII